MRGGGGTARMAMAALRAASLAGAAGRAGTVEAAGVVEAVGGVVEAVREGWAARAARPERARAVGPWHRLRACTSTHASG